MTNIAVFCYNYMYAGVMYNAYSRYIYRMLLQGSSFAS